MRKHLTHETGILGSSDSLLGWVFSLVLDCLKSEVIKLNLSGIEPLCVLEQTAVKLCTSRNLPYRPTNTSTKSYHSPVSYHV